MVAVVVILTVMVDGSSPLQCISGSLLPHKEQVSTLLHVQGIGY